MKNRPITRRKALRDISLFGLVLTIGRLPVKAAEILQKSKSLGLDIWDKLRRKIQSLVISKQDTGYESLRQKMVWNGIIPNAQPDAIIQIKKEEDLSQVVKFARQNNLKVSVRGRGHHASSPFMQNDCILVDISELKQIEINESAKTAVVGAGVQGKELSLAASKYNLAFPVGHCPIVPMSGYLLGGGFGWNGAAWGVGCSNVTAVDVINYKGEIIHANDTQNQDYLWAARGAGPGFFGIVIRYYLRLFSCPKKVLHSAITYPLDATNEVAKWLDDSIHNFPDSVELGCIQVPGSKDSSGRMLVVNAKVFTDTIERGKAALLPMSSAPPGFIHRELNVETTFIDIQNISEQTNEPNRIFQDSYLIDSKPSVYLKGLLEIGNTSPSPLSTIMMAFKPVYSKIDKNENMAFSCIGNTYVAAYGEWKNPIDDQDNKDWVNKITEYMEPFTIGHYVNESNLKYSSSRPSLCFSKNNWTKLQKLKKAYDPEGLFTYFPKV